MHKHLQKLLLFLILEDELFNNQIIVFDELKCNFSISKTIF